jgi:hypothetical protein
MKPNGSVAVEVAMKTHQLLTGSYQYRACAVVALTLFLGGCGGGTMFALKDPGYSMKPTSISVITGGSEESDLKLAEYLTKELKERTTLEVVDQSDVSKAIPNYPITIKAITEKDGEVAWVDPSEKPKIEKIQAKLKTNYVFVIWSRGLAKGTYCSNQGGCTNTYSTNVFGNMLEYPAGKSSRTPPSASATATASWHCLDRRDTTSTSCSKNPLKTSSMNSSRSPTPASASKGEGHCASHVFTAVLAGDRHNPAHQRLCHLSFNARALSAERAKAGRHRRTDQP